LIVVKDPKRPRQPGKVKLREIRPTVPALPDEITSLAVCQKNLAVAVGCKDGSITLVQVDEADGNVVKLPTRFGGHSAPVTGLAFRPDGQVLVSSSTDEASVAFWDPKTGKQRFNAAGTAPGLGVCVAPHGALAASGHRDGKVRLWETATGKQVGEIAAGAKDVKAVAFNSDGRRLAAGGGDFVVQVWDLYAKPPKKIPLTP
jgi:WD40 repeat protein